jgi:hypothetical protein
MLCQQPSHTASAYQLSFLHAGRTEWLAVPSTLCKYIVESAHGSRLLNTAVVTVHPPGEEAHDKPAVKLQGQWSSIQYGHMYHLNFYQYRRLIKTRNYRVLTYFGKRTRWSGISQGMWSPPQQSHLQGFIYFIFLSTEDSTNDLFILVLIQDNSQSQKKSDEKINKPHFLPRSRQWGASGRASHQQPIKGAY